jgi:hypothetical protein
MQRASCTRDRSRQSSSAGSPSWARPAATSLAPNSIPLTSNPFLFTACLLSASLPASLLPGEARPATPLEGAPWPGEGSQVAAQSQDGGDLAPPGCQVECYSTALECCAHHSARHHPLLHQGHVVRFGPSGCSVVPLLPSIVTLLAGWEGVSGSKIRGHLSARGCR